MITITKTAQIEAKLQAAGEKGLAPRELKSITSNPVSLLGYLQKQNKAKRVGHGRYVLSGAQAKDTHITVEPVKPQTEKELYDKLMQTRREFRQAKQEWYGFLAETR